MYKKNREMKVYNIYQGNEYHSQIRLSGAWLEELGFQIGDKLNVACEGGKITITKADEILVEE